MRPIMVFVSLGCVLAALPAAAQKETPAIDGGAIKITKVTVTEVIPIKFMSCDDLAAKLNDQNSKKSGATAARKLPAGIDKILPVPRTNSLLVVGQSDAISELRKTVSAIDVETTAGIHVQMKVLRFDFDADGTWDVKTIASPAIVTLDNSPATISVTGDEDAYSVDVTPHKNADGTISVKGELRAIGEHAAFRRDTLGRPGGIVAGVSNSHSAAVRKAAALGRIPSVKGDAYTVYYLQIVSVK